ncbi:sodium/pantothenate symporter [Blautia wexlerae]|uniref:sodium/pantothenate symporter n=1 Tax=Blautia wexlerae TaxID=418240 RepID=UPI000E53D5DC|nr:sodium:solute symporter family protein [Blautia wexlerae]RHO13509.1 sodium:solute symporter family protein [Ruminococcus sp. AM18-44]RHO21357.1 sodium:solute symporter family protein [Ruminococcus sp. AM18-15]RHS61754.1 sodium:solute symporter family protein [Ruminococcus sp. AM45-9BH]RHS69128.1 sodium:solute symporter family protein [Ruminococcus sp. AM45-2]MCB5688789.1 sodium:solute symporter family protein [Blautia wexlerae]
MNGAAVIQPAPIPFYTVLVLYLGIMAFIGWYAGRKTNNIGDFFVLSGKAGVVVSGIAYFSTQFSMGTFLGTPGTIYGVGYAGMAISVPGAVFCMILPALLIGRKLITLGHKYGFLTMADYLTDRYHSKNMSGVLGVMMLFFLVPMMGAQIIGAGVIVHVFTGLPEWVGVVGMGIIVILYCMTGGMKGAMMTDVIQGSLMIATAVVTFIVSIVMGGGFSNINHTLQSMNEAYLTFPGANGYMPWTYYISNIVLWSFFTMGQPHLFTKFFAMKDHKTMFKAILLGTAGMFFSATLIEWAGVNGIASIQNIEKADQIIPMILQRGMNPFLASIFIAGIVAAGMSTIDGILVTTTGAVTRDIYQKIINKNATDEAVMSLSKVVTVIIGIVVICFGVFQPGSIFEINLFAFSGMAIFVVPILFGIYWKKATAKGAVASVIVGIISLLLFTLNPSVKALAMGFHALFPTTIIASIVMIVVSKFTETPPQETIDRHFTV